MAQLEQVEQFQEARVRVRWIVKRDVPAVLAIENESSEFPWNEEVLVRALRQKNIIGNIAEYASDKQLAARERQKKLIVELDKTSDKNKKAEIQAEYSALDTGTIAGFSVYGYYTDKIRVLRLGVSKAFQNQGIGEALLDSQKRKLNSRKRVLLADVEEKHLPIFEQQGFQKTPILLARWSGAAKTLQQLELCTMPDPADEQSLITFLPDSTTIQAINWFLGAVEGLKKSIEKGKRQVEFDVIARLLKEYAAENSGAIRVKEAAGVVRLDRSTGFVRAGIIRVEKSWQKKATAVKETLLDKLCHMASAPTQPVYAELEESDLPLYQDFGFIPVAKVIKYRV